MSKYLRHRPTGDIMICTPELIARDDMVEISDEDAQAMLEQAGIKLKPNNARAKKSTPAVPKAKTVKKAAEPAPDPGVDNDAGDVAAALLSGDE